MFGGSPPCEEYWKSEAVFAGKMSKKATFYVEDGEGIQDININKFWRASQ